MCNGISHFLLLYSPLNSRSSTNISRQSTQDYSDPDLLYESRDHSNMASPARARWIDAFNKVCAQFNGVCINLVVVLDLSFFITYSCVKLFFLPSKKKKSPANSY